MTVIKSALLVLLQRYARLPLAKRAAWLSSPSKIRRTNTDVTVFPKAFEAHGDQLTEGAVVIVFGKVEDGKLIADGISFMSDADAAEN